MLELQCSNFRDLQSEQCSDASIQLNVVDHCGSSESSRIAIYSMDIMQHTEIKLHLRIPKVHASAMQVHAMACLEDQSCIGTNCQRPHCSKMDKTECHKRSIPLKFGYLGASGVNLRQGGSYIIYIYIYIYIYILVYSAIVRGVISTLEHWALWLQVGFG